MDIASCSLALFRTRFSRLCTTALLVALFLPVAAHPEALWVTTGDFMDNKLFRIDPETFKITGTVLIDAYPRGIAAGEGAVWITDYAQDKVVKINPASLKVEAAIGVDKAPTQIVTAMGSVWVINSNEGLLTRIDPGTNKVLSTVKITNSLLSDIAYGEKALWVASVNFLVTRVDPGTEKIDATIRVAGNPNPVTVGGHAVWAFNPMPQDLLKIDPATNKNITIKVGKPVRSMVYGKGGLWLAHQKEGAVSYLDVESGAIKHAFKVAGEVNDLCFAEGTLWAGCRKEKKVFAIDPGSSKIRSEILLEAGPAFMAFGP